jgi:hypothetical protein
MKKYLLTLPIVLLFLGCQHQPEIRYIKPDYPTLYAPRAVSKLYVTIKKQNGHVCMWRNGHNTHLCDEDLDEVITHIQKLRANEKTCQRIIREYNSYVRAK